MSKKIFVGNLPFDCPQRELEDEFKKFGDVRSISVKNRFAFIEYNEDREGDDAIREMDGKNFKGNRLKVEAQKGRDSRGGGGRGDRSVPYGSSKCYNCGEVGHFARECNNERRMDALRSRRDGSEDRNYIRSPPRHRHSRTPDSDRDRDYRDRDRDSYRDRDRDRDRDSHRDRDRDRDRDSYKDRDSHRDRDRDRDSHRDRDRGRDRDDDRGRRRSPSRDSRRDSPSPRSRSPSSRRK